MPETFEVVPKAKLDLSVPAQFSEAEAAEAAAMMARITAPTGDRIRINKDKTFQLPDGRVAPTLIGVVVDFVSINEYYPGKFDPKNFATPVCVAIAVDRKDLRPFAKSPDKQADECAICWAGQWGSDGKGKACKDQRMLAILPVEDQAEGPMMLLKVSPTGTRYWDQHVATLSNMLASTPVKVHTEISFDPNLDYASLRFSSVGPNESWATAFARHAEARKRLLTEPELAPIAVAEAPPAKSAKK